MKKIKRIIRLVTSYLKCTFSNTTMPVLWLGRNSDEVFNLIADMRPPECEVFSYLLKRPINQMTVDDCIELADHINFTKKKSILKPLYVIRTSEPVTLSGTSELMFFSLNVEPYLNFEPVFYAYENIASYLESPPVNHHDISLQENVRDLFRRVYQIAKSQKFPMWYF